MTTRPIAAPPPHDRLGPATCRRSPARRPAARFHDARFHDARFHDARFHDRAPAVDSGAGRSTTTGTGNTLPAAKGGATDEVHVLALRAGPAVPSAGDQRV